MAEGKVMISGVLWDKQNKVGRAVALIGDMIAVAETPPSSPGTPTHPIALPGDPWWGQDLHPAHPIVLPDPPVNPPTDPTEPKPPPPGGGWGWHPEYGWGYFPMGGGKPQPPGGR